MKAALRLIVPLIAGLLAAGAGAAFAFPDKQVRIIVPFPPGGSADFVGRLVAEKLTPAWGKPVVVENRPGGSATIGLGAVAKSAPDGYTIGIATASFAIQPSIRITMPYDSLADFEFVTQIMETPFVLTVNSSLPVNSLKDLVAYAKANPGKLNIGSFGVGSTPHILAEILSQQTGTKIVHVPFKGSADGMAAQLAGDVPLNFDVVMSPLPQIKQGRLRPILVTSLRRYKELPDTPTGIESGIPELEMPTWFGFLAPKGVPADTLKTLNTAIVQVLKSADVGAAFDKQAMTVVTSTPEEFRGFVTRSMQRVANAVRAAGIPKLGLTAMAGYLIAEVDVTDVEAYEEYKRIVPASVEAHGGRFLVRGGTVVPKEGGWNPKRVIVVEFPSLEAAKKFYDSPEYARALGIRLKATNSRLVLVEGA